MNYINPSNNYAPLRSSFISPYIDPNLKIPSIVDIYHPISLYFDIESIHYDNPTVIMLDFCININSK